MVIEDSSFLKLAYLQSLFLPGGALGWKLLSGTLNIYQLFRKLLKRAKSAVADARLRNELLGVLNYRPIVSLLPTITAPNSSISQAYQSLSEISFGTDPACVQSYIAKRIRDNDMSMIMNMTRPEISPMEYRLLQGAHCTTLFNRC